jgi:hypothetical protein
MATKQYMNVKTAADLWGLTERRVRILCSDGRVDGVIRNGWAWNIPVGTEKPQDGRSLRHIKNIALRPGAAHYEELDTLHASFLKQKGDEGYVLRTFRSNVSDFLCGAFALDGMTIDRKEVDKLFEGEVPSLPLEPLSLAMNVRTILTHTILDGGFGPIAGRGGHDEPFLSERKLRFLFRTLLSGIDDTSDGSYRKASIEQQMAILLFQYEKEWQMFHPLVRASFLFGELMRIRPFGKYDGLFALLAMSEELLSSSYPYVVLLPDQCEELRADLSLTQRRGNYQALIALFEGDLVKLQKTLMRKKDQNNG